MRVSSVRIRTDPQLGEGGSCPPPRSTAVPRTSSAPVSTTAPAPTSPPPLRTPTRPTWSAGPARMTHRSPARRYPRPARSRTPHPLPRPGQLGRRPPCRILHPHRHADPRSGRPARPRPLGLLAPGGGGRSHRAPPTCTLQHDRRRHLHMVRRCSRVGSDYTSTAPTVPRAS